MAMTKAEKLQLDNLKHENDILMAVCRTDIRDIVPMTPTQDIQIGWFVNQYLTVELRHDVSGCIRKGCFRTGGHAYGDTTKTDCQGAGGPWYSNYLDALRIARHQAETQFFERLASFDIAIRCEKR